MRIRQPAVAGLFYPEDANELQAAVNHYLETAVPAAIPLVPKAIIAPHAGYIYSGSIAGSAYQPLQGRMKQVRRVLLVGPAHTELVTGLAAVTVDAFATPFGEVPVDHEAVAAIRPLAEVHLQDSAHAREHGLEVQLPFLQMIAQDFMIVPLVVGQTTGTAVGNILAALWGGAETLIVISSDLSHYLPYEAARRRDQETAAAIESLQPDLLATDSACGRLPIQGLLKQVRAKGLSATVVDLRNSGDTAGSKERVVGYGAFLFG